MNDKQIIYNYAKWSVKTIPEVGDIIKYLESIDKKYSSTSVKDIKSIDTLIDSIGTTIDKDNIKAELAKIFPAATFTDEEITRILSENLKEYKATDISYTISIEKQNGLDITLNRDIATISKNQLKESNLDPIIYIPILVTIN